VAYIIDNIFNYNQIFDALIKYGRLFVFLNEKDNDIIIFRRLTVSELEFVIDRIFNANQFQKIILENYIWDKIVLHYNKKLDINEIDAGLPTTICNLALSKSAIYDIDKVVDAIEEKKKELGHIISLPKLMALKFKPDIDFDNISYEELLTYAAMWDSQQESSLKERYEEAKREAKLREAEAKSKGAIDVTKQNIPGI